MPSIKVLDKNVAELIAAGEVIESPASVIKELIENSVDAGAKNITIEISGGGVSYMRITDDGCGIAHEEVPVSFLRHATSKVRNENDLESIATMGFRGEALASVAAVAAVEMLTKKNGNETGTSYRISGGEEISYVEAACPDGTTIIIRDLFFNTPARLKFLRKDVSEGNAVQSVIEKLALVNSGIAFRFIRDNKPALLTSGDGTLISAIYSVFGKQFSESLVEVDFSQSGIAVKGYVSSPLHCRGNRTMQYFFVNRRYVKSPSCVAALEEGYRNSLMTGKFPACVLNIELAPSNVDVNVHPAKTAVRFTDDRAVFSAVYLAVKNAILNADNIKEIKLEKVKKEAPKPVLNHTESQQITLSSSYESYTDKAKPVKEGLTFKQAANSDNTTVFKHRVEINTDFDSQTQKNDYKYINEEKTAAINAKSKTDTDFALSDEDVADNTALRVIGEIWSTYIVCEDSKDNHLILIDKHAAHERIRFEALKNEFINSSQILAESIFVSMDGEECDIILRNKDILEDIGIDILKSGSNSLEVIAVPSALTGKNIDNILSDAAAIFKNGGRAAKDVIFEELLHSVACKSAVKAGDKSDIADLTRLANEVYNNKNIRFCPHGRPVVITLSKYEIEKNFGRV